MPKKNTIRKTVSEQRLEAAAAAKRKHFRQLCKLPGFREGFERFILTANENAVALEKQRKASN